MKLIDSSVEVISIDNPFLKIEKVGRTCYKSSSDMTEETAKRFYRNLVNRKHTAMLEHVNFVFEVSEKIYSYLYGHKYFNYSVEEFEDRQRYLISGNLRAINESGEIALLSVISDDIDPDLVYDEGFKQSLLRPTRTEVKLVDIDSLPDVQEHAYRKHKYVTFHFVCDRGVSHEIVRHRPASYAQESTRYCNYSKEQFGNEITYIRPANYCNWEGEKQYYFEQALNNAEDVYLRLLKSGCTPQEARAVLPNALKTEIIMTASYEEFYHFFNLRSLGTTGAPHPDMKVVADKAYALFMKNTKVFIY